MVVRLRRSRGEVRQQVRLIALSAALIGVGVVALFVVQVFNGGKQTWAAALPLFLSYTFLPVLFGIAVLRYRLYDVEVIVNRTLVIIIGTAFAAIGYTTLVVTVGSMVDSRTGGIGLSLLGTVVVALAFQPLRRQVIRLANRLAYGSRAQPYEALSDFSHRLAETPSATTLLPAVADAARQAVSARGAAAVLHAHGCPRDVGASRAPAGRTPMPQTLAVRHGRDELGSIRVWLPGGERLRPADVRLLEALAGQTAVVFRNVALEAQLAAHVAELDRTTDDLARSRARIIAADDAARRAMEAAISREVLPHLTIAPDGISRARAAIAAGQPQTGLDELVASTNTALDALRELTRGLFPDPARAGRHRARARILPGPQRIRGRPPRAPLHGRSAVLRAGGGSRLLVQRRRGARVRRADHDRALARPRARCWSSCAASGAKRVTTYRSSSTGRRRSVDRCTRPRTRWSSASRRRTPRRPS